MKSTTLIATLAFSTTAFIGHTAFASNPEEHMMENFMHTYSEVELVADHEGSSFTHYEGQLFDPLSVQVSGVVGGVVSRIGVHQSPEGFFDIDFSVRRQDGMESNFSSMGVDFTSSAGELMFNEDYAPYPNLLSSVSMSFNPDFEELDAGRLSQELENLMLGQALSIASHAPQNGFSGDVQTDEMAMPGQYVMWRDEGELDLHLANAHEHWTMPVVDGMQEVFFPNNLRIQLDESFSIANANPAVQFKVRRIEEMVDRIVRTVYEDVVRSRTVFHA